MYVLIYIYIYVMYIHNICITYIYNIYNIYMMCVCVCVYIYIWSRTWAWDSLYRGLLCDSLSLSPSLPPFLARSMEALSLPIEALFLYREASSLAIEVSSAALSLFKIPSYCYISSVIRHAAPWLQHTYPVEYSNISSGLIILYIYCHLACSGC